jgi:hypothetical protein
VSLWELLMRWGAVPSERSELCHKVKERARFCAALSLWGTSFFLRPIGAHTRTRLNASGAFRITAIHANELSTTRVSSSVRLADCVLPPVPPPPVTPLLLPPLSLLLLLLRWVLLPLSLPLPLFRKVLAPL